ncbi:MAG: TIGR01620 family protein [Hyphomicrobiales bacterium]
MTEHLRKPVGFALETDDDQQSSIKPSSGRARASIEFAPDLVQPPAVIPPMATLPASRKFRWGTILVSAVGALVVMWAGLGISQLIESLFARSVALGWLASGLAGLAGLAALAIVIREIWALARLEKIERLQADAAHALNFDDTDSAKRAISSIKSLYAGRADIALGLKTLAELDMNVIDPADRIRLADRELLKPLDLETHRIIARSARRVTMLTTLTPTAVLDILFVAAQNLRMLREIATLYGGRPSTLSTLRLARMVISHLAVTGSLALSDSLIQHMIGKGLVGRISARFGEGTVNGIMTSRIGLAAADVCRPIPQSAETKETLAGLARELVTFRSEAAQEATETSGEPKAGP